MTKLMKVLFICLFVAVPLTTVQAQVTLTVGDGSGFLGSSDNPVAVILDNPSEKVKAVNLDVCDVDDYLSCSGCETTERTSGFVCQATEQDNGCVSVVLFVVGGDLIEEAVEPGAIFTLNFDVSPSAPSGASRTLTIENEQVANDLNLPLDVSTAPGNFSFLACSSDDDCGEGTCNEETGSCSNPTTTTSTPGSSTTTTTEPAEGCQVTVACDQTALCDDNPIAEDCATCTATTECDGVEISGTYTWELNGAVTTSNTGNSIEICGADLIENQNTLTATDIANDNIQGSATLYCGGVPGECSIDVLNESVLKSHWFVLPGLIRIRLTGDDCSRVNLFTNVNIACDSDRESVLGAAVLKTGKTAVLGTIWQTFLVLPAWWTQSMELESETCTVTVGDIQDSDTFQLNYLDLFGIPLSE